MQVHAPTDPSGLETLEIFSKAQSINRWLYQKIKPHLSGRILEVGSGIGNISNLLLENHQTISLSDFRPDYCAILKRNFEGNKNLENIYQLDISSPDFSSQYPTIINHFDTVIALNVVEHIENDFLALTNAKTTLKKNGQMIVLVPAGKWLYNKLDQELGHYQRYDRKGLTSLFETAGFQVSSIRFFNSPAILGWWLAGNLMKKDIIPSWQLKLYNRLVPFFKLVDMIINPFTGISLIAVGVKK